MRHEQHHQRGAVVMNGYDNLKQLQRDLKDQGVKKSLTDLIIMARKNDPFIIGSPAHVAQAHWFADLWQRWNTNTSHIRRIHYKLISQDEPYLKPSGEPYQNTIDDWVYVCAASKYARILGLVDPDEFTDNRNDPTVINLCSRENPVPVAAQDEETGNLHLPYFSFGFSRNLTLPDIQISGYHYEHSDQPYYLLLIIEKTTMDDVLEPICRHYGVNYLAGAGYTSITRVRDELARMQEFGKPVRVFYISDFDPAGDAMPRAVSRQTEYWLKDFDSAGIKIDHIGLTRQQCIDYQLPRTPIKETDCRKANWENRYGDGATELDALEAIYPGELRRIVTEAISPYRDMELEYKLSQAEDETIEAVNEVWDEITQDEQTELERIMDEAEEIIKPYQSKLSELNKKLQPLRDRLKTVSHETLKKSRHLDEYLTPRPEAETTPQDESGWLFDSDRDYLDQLSHYKKHRGGLI